MIEIINIIAVTIGCEIFLFSITYTVWILI